MKVIFEVSIASGEWGAYAPGETGDIPDDEARRLIDAGYAKPAGKGAAGRETREIIPDESAARINAAGRKGKI